jgi:hypothetical protein
MLDEKTARERALHYHQEYDMSFDNCYELDDGQREEVNHVAAALLTVQAETLEWACTHGGLERARATIRTRAAIKRLKEGK